MARTLFFFPCSKNTQVGSCSLSHDKPSLSAQSNPSYSVVASQIIWFGIGLSLLSDTLESFLHWPHLLAVALSSCLMIASAWIGIRSMVILSAFLLPVILSSVFLSLAQVDQTSGFLGLWTQMVRLKSIEYISGLFLVMGSIIGTSANGKKSNTGPIVACLGFAVGNGLMVFSDLNYAIADGQASIMPILAQHGSSMLGLCLLGLSARTSSNSKLSICGKVISQFTRIPLRGVVLVAGTASAVYFDWCFQYVVGWPQYVGLCVPPLILMFLADISSVKSLLKTFWLKFLRLTVKSNIAIIPAYLRP